MRYVLAWHEREMQEKAYRIYITDSLYAISKRGSVEKRYIELLTPVPMDERSGDEIAMDIITKHSLKVK